MTVTVQAGFAICGSCLKLEEVARTLAVQASDANYDRIDSVVLRLNTNDNARYCDLYVVQGIPSTSPVRPTLTRTSTIWELGLADIFIAKNSGAISAARITDTRHDATRCGVISSVSEFDTTTIYNQVQADLAEFKAEEQADFLTWYEQMRNQLSEDAAGNLQAQIDTMKGSILDTMEEINANTQENQLAGALAVKELRNALDAYCPKQAFHDDEDVLVYADSILEKYEIAFIPISVIGGSGSGASYSSGFITTRYDTCSVVIFNYQSSRIVANSRSKAGKWTGWEHMAFYRELANYLPLSGGTMSGELVHKAGSRWSYNDRNMLIEIIGSTFGFWDSTNSKWWLNSETDKTNIYQPLFINGSKVLTASDFTVTGTTSEAKLTINLD